MYALVLGLLLVLGLSGDASGMCGESRQQIRDREPYRVVGGSEPPARELCVEMTAVF